VCITYGAFTLGQENEVGDRFHLYKCSSRMIVELVLIKWWISSENCVVVSVICFVTSSSFFNFKISRIRTEPHSD
jgi:hypothetical protein